VEQAENGPGEAELLRVEDLRLAFDLHGSPLEVVKGVSFRIKPGSVVALVGESGSGKSVFPKRSWASCRARPP